MGENEISLKDYLGEKIDSVRDSIKEIKNEFRINQLDTQNKILKMENDINERFKLIENELNEIKFIKKYWKVFAVALVLFGLTTIYTVKNQFFTNEVKRNNIENTISK